MTTARELKAGHIATRMVGTIKISMWFEQGVYHISANDGDKPLFWTTEPIFKDARTVFNESPQ